jgi:predicted RND superfamily exporter protein
MEHFARFITRKHVARVIVGAVAVLAATSLQLSLQVEHDDDLLAFLPKGNAEVETFYAVNKRFGGLDLALVGLETEDVFAPEFVRGLDATTRRLEELEGLAHVVSLSNVEDFSPDADGGIVAGRLIDRVPTSMEERDQLSTRVLSRDQVVGNLVSEDGKAALIYCALAVGEDPRAMAGKIRAVVRKELPATRIIEGGNPFISASIYDTTQRDMRTLTPWSVAVIVLILVVAFRNLLGSCLALVSTGVGILSALGAMSAAGETFNIVLGSMPIILFAVGSAYSIHILARYYAQPPGRDPTEAIVETLVTVGPTVIAAGLTTIAGFASFLLMDIEPLQTFGRYTAIGIFVTLVLALTFIPAVIVLLELKPRQDATESAGELWGRLARWSHQRRLWVVAGVVVVVCVSALWVGRVDSRMDPKSFYSEGSGPDLADRFLADRFGGAQFIQLHLRGDLEDPEALRELRWLADEIRAQPQVTSVTHVGQVVALVNEAFEGQARVPDTRAKVRSIYGMIVGQPSVGQLMTDDRTEALLHVKVNASGAEETERVLARIESLVEGWTLEGRHIERRDGPRGDAVSRKLVSHAAARIRAEALMHGVPMDDSTGAELVARLSSLEVQVPTERVAERITTFLNSDESLIDLEEETEIKGDATSVGTAVAALGPAPQEAKLYESISEALGVSADSELVDDAVVTLSTPLREIWAQERARAQAMEVEQELKLAVPDGGHGDRFRASLATALTDLSRSSAWIAGGGEAPLQVAVTGLPVLHRGLSRSVRTNQVSSLVFALGVVLVLMTLLFRSPLAGLVASFPTALTLLVIYGGMGWMEIRLDIGTSMLGSLIIGAGVDYGVHLMSAWRAPLGGDLGDAAEEAGRTTGPAIWTNALTVSAGFFVLTLGEARPLQNVGGLTASAMLCAALITFLAVPAFARRLSYAPERSLAVSEEIVTASVDA